MSNKAKDHIIKDAKLGLIVDIVWVIALFLILTYVMHEYHSIDEYATQFILFYVIYVGILATIDLLIYRD